MSKRGLITFILFFLCIAILVPLSSADETSQIDKAYSCLLQKINSTGCSDLSFEQQVFSLMTVNKCSAEVINSNKTISSGNSNLECWPASSCNLKLTSQVLLGLSKYKPNYNLSSAKSWVLSNKIVPTDLDWFIEIESDGESSCNIYYPGYESGVKLQISSDKKLSSSGLGNCLSISKSDYLLKVSPQCYNQEISIQCNSGNNGFITTLLFQKSGSSTMNILSEVKSSSSGGTLNEKINSWCLSNPNSNTCNYEGTLWASQVLFALDEDVSLFLPYLVASAEDNLQYLPESGLYYLTGKQNFLTSLLSKQKASKYWSESGSRYYDTSFALLPLQYESPFEKTNAKNWLLKDQQSSGCWNNDNLRDTAFVLYSIWPRDFPLEEINNGSICGNNIVESGEECDTEDLNGKSCLTLGYDSGNLSCYSSTSTSACKFNKLNCIVPQNCTVDGDCPVGYGCTSGGQCIVKTNGTDYECDLDSDCSGEKECVNHQCVDNAPLNCVDSGNFCVSPVDCGVSDTLASSDYSCSSILYTCCLTKKTYGTCSSNGGEICSSSQTCSGNSINADDVSLSQICCSGTCETSSAITATCETSGNGICRSSCLSTEQSTAFYTCDSSNNICCISSTAKKNYTWIWILLILIILVVLGIVFREKIKDFFMKLKTKSKKKTSFSSGDRPLYGGLRPLPRTAPHSIPPQRRIVPHVEGKQAPVQKKPTKASMELEEVLKKLKDIGKK